MLKSSFLVHLKTNRDLIGFDFKVNKSVVNVWLNSGIYLVFHCKNEGKLEENNKFAWIIYKKKLLLVRKEFAENRKIIE
jgi:hypothetical protein